MSWRISERVWNASKSRGGARLVLLALADYANDNGVCFPGRKALMKKATVADRALDRACRWLTEHREITIKVNGGPKGCNLYTVILPPVETTPAPRQDDAGRQNDAPRRNGTHPPVVLTVNPPSKRRPEPSGTVIEPSSSSIPEPQAAVDGRGEGSEVELSTDRIWERTCLALGRPSHLPRTPSLETALRNCSSWLTEADMALLEAEEHRKRTCFPNHRSQSTYTFLRHAASSLRSLRAQAAIQAHRNSQATVVPPAELTPQPAPPPAKKAASPKPASTADPRFKPVTDGYASAYRDFVGESYAHMGGKDGMALKRLLKSLPAGEYSAEQIVAVARTAFDCCHLPYGRRASGWAGSLSSFCYHFSDIRNELNLNQRSSRSARPANVPACTIPISERTYEDTTL